MSETDLWPLQLIDLLANCAAAKLLAMTPTNNPTLWTSTSGKDAAISGRYGDMLFKAVCSANDMMARISNCFVGMGVSRCLLGPLSGELEPLRVSVDVGEEWASRVFQNERPRG